MNVGFYYMANAGGRLTGTVLWTSQCKPGGGNGNERDNDGGSSVAASEGTVVEPAREIPIITEPEVLVIGGGPAGVAAALSASRTGVSTMLVERYNHLGGLWTGGLVLPLLSTHAVDRSGRFRQVIYGIGDDMVQRLRRINMSINDVNPLDIPRAPMMVRRYDSRISSMV